MYFTIEVKLTRDVSVSHEEILNDAELIKNQLSQINSLDLFGTCAVSSFWNTGYDNVSWSVSFAIANDVPDDLPYDEGFAISTCIQESELITLIEGVEITEIKIGMV